MVDSHSAAAHPLTASDLPKETYQTNLTIASRTRNSAIAPSDSYSYTLKFVGAP